MSADEKELMIAAELHHEMMFAIARQSGRIAITAEKDFDRHGRISGALPFRIVASEEKAGARLRETAAELARNVEALERLKKPLAGPGVGELVDLYHSLRNAGSLEAQIGILKATADKSSKGKEDEGLALAVVIGQTGKTSFYDKSKVTTALEEGFVSETRMAPPGLSGISAVTGAMNDIAAADMAGASMGARLGASVEIASFLARIPPLTTLVGEALRWSVVWSALEFTSKFVDVIHGPNDPNGPIWWPTGPTSDPRPGPIT